VPRSTAPHQQPEGSDHEVTKYKLDLSTEKWDYTNKTVPSASAPTITPIGIWGTIASPVIPTVLGEGEFTTPVLVVVSVMVKELVIVAVEMPGHWLAKPCSNVPGQSLMQRGGEESPVPFQAQVIPMTQRSRFTSKRRVQLQIKRSMAGSYV